MTSPTGPTPATATEAQQAAVELTHRQILVVFSGLMLGMLLAALDQTIVSTALPTIVGELGGLDHLSWVVTAYLLTSTASTPLYGKISDIYGRKVVFQAAIVIFLVGSVLAGASQTMGQLIATRAVQGLGGGGLMALALAIVGDLVPPRQRGRYQGYFGAVFGVASVAGPLLGGFFTDSLTWRWVFYINVPLGLLALVVTSSVLRLEVPRTRHAIDHLGAALLVASVTCLLLVTVWAGTEYAWTSATVVGLGVAGVVLLVLFVWRERRAPEPLLPLRLFADRVFAVGNLLGFLLGFAMFGAIVFMPLYLQVVKGASATASGLLLLPLMLGILTASIGSGRIISAVGRYKVFPVVGTGLMTVAFVLLTRLGTDTSYPVVSAFLLVLGLGIGSVMQVLVLAVQNSVARRDMGVATSSTAFFRSMGGAFGTAVFGAVLAGRLGHHLATSLPADALPAGAEPTALLSAPEQIRQLPGPVQDALVESFVRALDVVFWSAVPVAALAFLLAWLLPERPLSDHAATAAPAAPAVAPAAATAPTTTAPTATATTSTATALDDAAAEPSSPPVPATPGMSMPSGGLLVDPTTDHEVGEAGHDPRPDDRTALRGAGQA